MSFAEPSCSSPVSRAIWRWWETSKDPGPKKLIGGAARRVVAILLIGLALGLFTKRWTITGLLFAIAAGLTVCAWLCPRLYGILDRVMNVVAIAAGKGITFLLLVPFFYLVFVPGRLLLALSGRDPLNRRFPSDEPSYWVKRAPGISPAHYKKQYR